MKKRIFATLIALTLLLSAILVGCNGGGDESAQSEQASEGEVVSLKAIFESTLKNKLTLDENGELMQFLGELENYEMPEPKDVAGVMNTTVTKLQAGSIDLSSFGTVTLDGNVAYDAEGKRFSTDLMLNALGEKPKLAFVSDESGAYITDYFGLNEKPLFIDPEKQLESIDNEKLSRFENAIGAYSEIYEHIKTVSEQIIASDIEESAFTLASASSSAENVDYNNVMILLTLSGEKAKAVSDKLITELMKNESIKALIGEDFDKNELLSNADNIKELTVLNDIKNGETVGISIGISADNGEVSEQYLLASALIENDLGVSLGTLGENGKYLQAIELKYKREADTDKHCITADITDEGKAFNAVTAYMTAEEGRYDFDITVSNDGKTTVNAKLTFEGNAESGNIAVSEVTTTDESGKSTKLPIVLNTEYKIENEILTVKSLISANPNENISIEAESVFTGEYKEVTIEAVTESMPIEEFNFDAAKITFAFKYPKINAFMIMYELGNN